MTLVLPWHFYQQISLTGSGVEDLHHLGWLVRICCSFMWIIYLPDDVCHSVPATCSCISISISLWLQWLLYIFGALLYVDEWCSVKNASQQDVVMSHWHELEVVAWLKGWQTVTEMQIMANEYQYSCCIFSVHCVICICNSSQKLPYKYLHTTCKAWAFSPKSRCTGFSGREIINFISLYLKWLIRSPFST